MNEAPYTPSADINDNDKLMALLAYLIAIIVPIIILVSDSMKTRAYQKYHALNSIGLTVAEVVLTIVLCICISVISVVTAGIGSCLSLLLFVVFIPRIYYAIIAYAKPAYFEIPMITSFMKGQGWLNV